MKVAQPVDADTHCLGNIFEALSTCELVPAHDVRKQECVADTVSDVEASAKWIGQGMYRTDTSVAKRHATHEARRGHFFASNQVIRVRIGLWQSTCDKSDCAQRDGIGDR